MSTARSLPRSLLWLRALVLLLAVLVPAAHAEGHPAAVSSGEIAEYDVLDTDLRPASRASHRAVARPRPVPRVPRPAPAAPQGWPLPAPAPPPHAPDTLRSVVLRC
ncbi:hypothetical protein GR925_20485 [Streptomyces sp. HUCO-GS316]|uniref:hypothetical protein n=1 Tax=Streptomyces sp. HUCO-GS316 TaxID=2692198 RepID=UPI001367E5A0|nr:hypothetical protein [Streptomyces sp. HUCO-GS316]MXM65762.1 hypothetical protein [Streptomyces sp. HUCO-GS316]